MDHLLLLTGRSFGALGALLCVAMAAVRLTGRYSLGGISVGAMFQAGMGAALIGCFCLLLVLTSRDSSNR